MKINQSAVTMAAERQASKAYASKVTVNDRYWVGAGAMKESESDRHTGWSDQSASLELSGSWKRLARHLEKLSGQAPQAAPGDTEEDFKIKMLKQLMESIRAFQEGRRPDYSKLERTTRRSTGFSVNAWRGTSFSVAVSGTGQVIGTAPDAGSQAPVSRVVAGGVGHWEEQVTMSRIFTEKEVTSFSTTGMVQTADGRNISFNLNLEMSREFTQAMGGIEYTRKTFCVDPLVINLEGNPASFSDQTFLFDLDSDGKAEELAQLSPSSGFLALDKNGDGVINDGSELFGTKSGDGFKDLAAYDEDGNGWIDENDSVFKDLKIWTKDENGKDRLVGIGVAGVGAIYLGKAATEFSLNKLETNETQGIVRSTGIFLKESGEAGTIQHVDMVI